MERFLNIIHFFIYKGQFNFSMLFYNLFVRLYRLPYMKKMSEKRGHNPEVELMNFYKDPQNGLSSIWAGGLMCGILFLIGNGITNSCLAILKTDITQEYQTIIEMIAIMVISIAINYFSIFKKYKYLKYFKGFEGFSKLKKRIWGVITLLVLIVSIVIYVGSFYFLSYRLHS